MSATHVTTPTLVFRVGHFSMITLACQRPTWVSFRLTNVGAVGSARCWVGLFLTYTEPLSGMNTMPMKVTCSKKVRSQAELIPSSFRTWYLYSTMSGSRW